MKSPGLFYIVDDDLPGYATPSRLIRIRALAARIDNQPTAETCFLVSGQKCNW